MVTGMLRRHGDTYVIDLRSEDVERYGLQDGQEVAIAIPEHAVAADDTWSADTDRRDWRALAKRSLARGWTEADRAYEQLL